MEKWCRRAICSDFEEREFVNKSIVSVISFRKLKSWKLLLPYLVLDGYYMGAEKGAFSNKS